MSNSIPKCRASRPRLFAFYLLMAFWSLARPNVGREMIEAANAFIAKRNRDEAVKSVLSRTRRRGKKVSTN